MSFVEKADIFGGEDNEQLYRPNWEEKPYYDKSDHFLRSLAHQNNHSKHVKRIIGPNPEIPRKEVLSRLSEEWFRCHLPVIRSRNQK